MKDMINHPSHYKSGRIEAIDVIEDFKLNFNLGNAVKYILRAGKKGCRKEDLKKAIWYLHRELRHVSSEAEHSILHVTEDVGAIPAHAN